MTANRLPWTRNGAEREDWQPIEEAPDDLAEGLFAYPDDICGYLQMVVYGYVSGAQEEAVVYDRNGIRPGTEEALSTSAKELALAGGATHWRPLPNAPVIQRPH